MGKCGEGVEGGEVWRRCRGWGSVERVGRCGEGVESGEVCRGWGGVERV